MEAIYYEKILLVCSLYHYFFWLGCFLILCHMLKKPKKKFMFARRAVSIVMMISTLSRHMSGMRYVFSCRKGSISGRPASLRNRHDGRTD